MPNGHETPQEWEADRLRQEYRESVIRRALQRLAPLVEARDAEAAHAEADAALCQALIDFGARPIVEAWEQVPKWYA